MIASSAYLASGRQYPLFPALDPNRPTYSYFPFDMRAVRLGGFLWDTVEVVAPQATVSLTKNLTRVGMPVTMAGVRFPVSEPQDVLFPGVTTGNIDGDGRVGIELYDGEESSNIEIDTVLRPEDAANKNAIVSVCTALSFHDSANGIRFAPLNSGSVVYTLPSDAGFWVHSEDGLLLPDGSSAAAFPDAAVVPCPIPGTFYAMTLVTESGGFPGAFTFTLRKNFADTSLTITTANDGTRIYTSGATVHCEAGDVVCWKVSGGTGAIDEGHLLVAYKPDPEDALHGWGEEGWGEEGWGGT